MKGRDALILMGFCVAIRTASFIAEVQEKLGASASFAVDPNHFNRLAFESS
jgi:hypothetical protein